MNINTGSVIKAGGIAAGVGLVLAILSGIPFLNCLVIPLLCIGAALLPIGAGMGYGYFTPGREEMSQSALGGALAGAFGGLAFGIGTGIMALITDAGAAVFLQDADIAVNSGGNLGGVLVSSCLFVVAGLVLGAIGGLLWPAFQRDKV